MNSIVGPVNHEQYSFPANCQHILACHNFYAASRYAAEQSWALRDWFWVPGTTAEVKRYDKVEQSDDD